jgi:hypothetical protein
MALPFSKKFLTTRHTDVGSCHSDLSVILSAAKDLYRLIKKILHCVQDDGGISG